jgi:hypothetical protein
MTSGKSLLLYQFTRRTMKVTSNYRGISLLSISYKILFNIRLPRLVIYNEEITENYQCGFSHK